MELTLEQKRALAKAAARKRMAEVGTPDRNPDGTYGQPPEGAFTNKAGQIADPALQTAADQRTLDAYGRNTARALEYVQSAPLVGEWLDEGVKRFGEGLQYQGENIPVVGPAIQRAGENFVGMADRMNQVSDAFERQHPIQATSIGVGGGIINTLPLAAAKGADVVGNFVSKGQGLLGKGWRLATAGGTGGAVEGGLASAGRADPGERLRGLQEGAAVGGTFGAVLGPAGAALGATAGEALRRWKGLDVKTISDELGVDAPTARIVKSYLANDDLDSALARLNAQGNDAILANAGAGTRQALDTAMSTGGEALATGRRVINARSQQAGQRFAASLDDILGAASGPKAATRQIAQRTAAERERTYNFAYSQPTPMTGPAAQKIDRVLRRAEPGTLRRAVEKANAKMRFDEVSNQNIMATIADDGSVAFSQPPSVMELDYIARGLAGVADEGTDAVTGKMTDEARMAMTLARNLRDAMRDAKGGGVKGYDRALRLGGDAIAEQEALVMGRKLLSETTEFEDVVNSLRGASDPVKAAARQGLRQNIDQVIGRARQTMTEMMNTGQYDASEAQQALAAIRAMSTPNAKRKARVVLGADANRLEFELQRVADALSLRDAVARNSATAIRQSGQEQLAAEAAPGLARRTVGNAGSPLEATQELTRAAAGTDAASLKRMTDAQAAKLADVLLRTQGPEAQRALQLIKTSMDGQPLTDAQAEFVSRVLGVSSASGAYQAMPERIGPM